MSGVFGSFERNFIVVCCALSLIFFFPLLTIRAPMTGDQEVSGYDVFSRVNGLREDLDRPSTEQLPSTEQTPSTRPPTSNGMPSAGHPKSNPGAAVADLPFSVEISWLIPIFIAVAFLSAAVA